MILGNEWTTYHLTRQGWVAGDKQREFAPLLSRPMPHDRVLSIVYKVVINRAGTKNNSMEVVWRSADLRAVNGLLARFGVGPRKL
jgi:hypothetical protein